METNCIEERSSALMWMQQQFLSNLASQLKGAVVASHQLVDLLWLVTD